ncbi:hypothetical protein J6590_035191 [Homalodisca vitripennis]|nr:hypothetical protein J6590_035191 [Homalodisca vitripennis]
MLNISYRSCASTVRRQSGSYGSATTGTDALSFILISNAIFATFGFSVFTVVFINVCAYHSDT